MAVLGHRSANMAMTYARISDHEVRRQYEIALTNGSRIAGPAEDAPCIDVNRWESHPTNVRTLSEQTAGQRGSNVRPITPNRANMWRFHGVLFPDLFPSER